MRRRQDEDLDQLSHHVVRIGELGKEMGQELHMQVRAVKCCAAEGLGMLQCVRKELHLQVRAIMLCCVLKGRACAVHVHADAMCGPVAGREQPVGGICGVLRGKGRAGRMQAAACKACLLYCSQRPACLARWPLRACAAASLALV